MKFLINEYVTGLRISDDQSVLIVDTPDAMIVYQAVGDCCSETWFADIIGVKYLIGATVKKVENLELTNYNLDDNRCRQDEDIAYGVKLITDKGEANIIYRNSSNGYYGGSVEFIGRIPTSLTPITDDWLA